jgi:IS30 family transposase
MRTPEKIRSFLETAAEYPGKSKLEPYLELIRSLRKKRWSYPQIADALQTEFRLPVAPSTIHNFLKVRSKRKREAMRDDTIVPPLSGAQPQPIKRPRFNLDA